MNDFVGKAITLYGDQVFRFNIQPYPLVNALGQEVAVLRQYNIEDPAGNHIQLFKTAEGNWYNLADEKASSHNILLWDLKTAIDLAEKEE